MSALRVLRQLSSNSSRRAVTQESWCISSTRRFSVLSRAGTAGIPRIVPKLNIRTFSSSQCVSGAGTNDLALVQKLQTELQYEKESGAKEVDVPESVKAFRDQGIWQLEDIPGNDEVTLTRTFGNEHLRLMFAVTDVQPEEQDEEDFENPENESERSEEDPIRISPIRASLAVTKTSAPGTLNIDMVVQEGQFVVDNISYYKDAKVGTELTADADWKRRGLYMGPQFDTLDVAVQEEFDAWLRERGVNESVALFIPDYAEFKEQREYVDWVENVKNFIEK